MTFEAIGGRPQLGQILHAMERLGDQACQHIAVGVAAELTTTCASQYKAEVSLEGALSREAVLDDSAGAT